MPSSISITSGFKPVVISAEVSCSVVGTTGFVVVRLLVVMRSVVTKTLVDTGGIGVVIALLVVVGGREGDVNGNDDGVTEEDGVDEGLTM